MTNHILIIGPSGSGKTYISATLRKQGVNALDADLIDGLSGWFGAGGKQATYPENTDKEFLDNHEFLWDRNFLSKFLTEQENDIYLFGMSGNVFDMVDLFNKVYFLKTSPEVLAQRLRHESRKNPMGRTDYQLQNALSWAKDIKKRAKNLGIEMIDANQTPEQVYLQLSRASIGFSKEDFENSWPLTNVKIGKILQKSGERIVCELSSSEGNFVFKIADPSKTEEKLKRDIFAFDFLKTKNFQNIPTLLKTKEGDGYKRLDNQFVYVMERIDGKTPERTPENWARLGEIAARLHGISDYPYETLFTVESETPKFAETAKKLSFADEYMKFVESLPNFSGLSTSLIHTDIGPHNAIQKPDGVIVLTDWDDAGIGTTILDLGFPLICHFVTHELNFEKEKAEAFYSTYFSKRNLPDTEKSLIFDASLFFALMYIPYGDTEKHWQRIKFAVQNKKLISSVLK